MIGEDIKQNEVYVNDLYDRRAAPHMAAIKALFDKLDISGTGKLSMDELRDVVAFYEASSTRRLSYSGTIPITPSRLSGLVPCGWTKWRRLTHPMANLI